MRTFSRVVQSAVDLLFPAHCVLCRRWYDADRIDPADRSPLCTDCAKIVDRERRQEACPTCASAVAPYEVSMGRCSKCRRRRLPIVRTVRVGPYSDGVAQLVRVYKYHAREELERVLGGWLAEVVHRASWADRVEAIVSVPTHWRHRIGRPLYAADALASVVAKNTGLPRVPILRRVRGGPHQIGLSYADRLKNVRGAFAMRRGVTLHDGRLLLLDDVKTTGATINECAKVLRRGGAKEVYAAVVVAVGWDQPTGFALSSI